MAARVPTRERLLARVWGNRYEGDPRTVDIHVRSPRAPRSDDKTRSAGERADRSDRLESDHRSRRSARTQTRFLAREEPAALAEKSECVCRGVAMQTLTNTASSVLACLAMRTAAFRASKNRVSARFSARQFIPEPASAHALSQEKVNQK